MIFVTVGMHHQGFERLIKAMDDLAAQIDEPVVMQIGASSYEPVHAEWFKFAPAERVAELTKEARVLVAHAGAGTIISSFEHRKPLIVVPRRADQDEHVDDHQIELASALAEAGKIVSVEEPSAESLKRALEQAGTLRPHQRSSSRLAAAVDRALHGNKSPLVEV